MRIFVGTALIAISLLVACGGNDRAAKGLPMVAAVPPPGASGGSARAEEARYLRLRRGAHLYDRAGGVRVHTLGTPSRSPQFSSMFRLVRDDGDWLVVRSVPGIPRPELCRESSATMLSAFELEFAVPRSAVYPVLTRPLRTRFDDGTSVELLPGVAVGALDKPSRPSLRWIYEGPYQILVDIADEYIGASFIPGTPFDDSGEQEERFVATAAFSSGDVLFGGNGQVGPTGKQRYPRALARAYSREDRGERALVELRTSCMRLWVNVAAEHVLEGSDHVFGLLSGGLSMVGKSDPWVVQKGADIYWRGGQRAGQVAQQAGLGAETTADGDRRCFAYTTMWRMKEGGGSEPFQDIELCFAASSIAPNPATKPAATP